MDNNRKYERPAMWVVEIRQRGLLMTSSNLDVTYTEEDWNND